MFDPQLMARFLNVLETLEDEAYLGERKFLQVPNFSPSPLSPDPPQCE